MRIITASLLLTACAPAPYAITPALDGPPRARWPEGALAARETASRELLPYECPEGELFVRELAGQRSAGLYEVYGCGRDARYQCEGEREPACRAER